MRSRIRGREDSKPTITRSKSTGFGGRELAGPL